ncbi:MAG: PIN domain-containing protein [Muribaculaceae bacterium]|nr:PIN domain-containing protein [Muribaculaceae bacterium]
MLLRKNMQLIDTNVILRFVLNDNDEMAKLATEVIVSGAYTKPEIIAEVVYVLKSVYSTPRDKIKSIIRGLSAIIRIENADCVVYAIDLFASTSLDFVDCLLVAYHSLNDETVFTFDKKLNKHLNTNAV